MAAAYPLEQEITCSVCLDIYEDPHTLIGCLHTYCLKCITQLKKRGQVQCPDCRTVTKMKDIKKDFKTQRLIDIHVVLMTKGEDKCGMCQNESIPLTNHCTDCKLFLCVDCSKFHRTNKALKSHKLMSTFVEKTIRKLENHVKNIDTKLKSVSQSLTDVEKVKIQQIEDVRKFTMECIEDMKKNQRRLETLINDDNQTFVNYLHQSRTLLEQNKTYMLSKITLLKDLMNNQDIRTLKETAETIKQDIGNFEDIFKRRNFNFKSPVTVEKNKSWDVKDSIEVSIDNIPIEYDSQQIGPVSETNYSDLHTNTFTLTHIAKLTSFPYSLSMINNQLWCVSANASLNVFDQNCQKLKNIKLEQINGSSNVAACGNEHVIVACSFNNGLHLLQSNGEYRSKIMDGSFADVVCCNGDIFALQYNTCNITVLRRERNKWSKINCYQLQHSNGSTWDRLCVQRSGIYVSSYNNNCIYVYDQHGRFQFTRGEEGPHELGELNNPLLCDVDSDGNMLVADRSNHRLQVCDRRGQWTVARLPKGTRCPTSVVVRDGCMWIASYSWPDKLEKYEKVNPSFCVII